MCIVLFFCLRFYCFRWDHCFCFILCDVTGDGFTPHTSLEDGELGKVTKRDLVVASTRHHRAPALAKVLPEIIVRASFVKSSMLRPLHTHFLIFQQMLFIVLIYIHPGNTRVPPRVLASGPKS